MATPPPTLPQAWLFSTRSSRLSPPSSILCQECAHTPSRDNRSWLFQLRSSFLIRVAPSSSSAFLLFSYICHVSMGPPRVHQRPPCAFLLLLPPLMLLVSGFLFVFFYVLFCTSVFVSIACGFKSPYPFVIFSSSGDFCIRSSLLLDDVSSFRFQ